MPIVNQGDILKVAGEVLPAATGGGDPMSSINGIVSGVNQFMATLERLSKTTGLPLIGDDAAIKRLTGTPLRKPVPTQGPTPEPSGPLLPAPAVQAPPVAPSGPDWPSILARAETELEKRGLSGLTVGQVLEFVKDKTLGDIVKAVKNGNQPKG